MLRRALLGLLVCVPVFAQPAERPYVLLISLDGFRYDYAQRYEAKNLLAFGARGVAAKALLPSYPTTTFPNHYSIATGLYPEHHGIVENSFWDPNLQAKFQFNDSKLASDTRFWGGTPLWVLAEKQGVRAGSYFWPGSDYEIQGTRPTYWHLYDGKVTKDMQIAEVINWLKLPPDKRPHFMTLYFPDVDHEGHSFGPDAEQTKQAVQSVDKSLGDLFAKIGETGVPLNIFIVSDHGMVATSGMVDLGKLANFEGVVTGGAGTDFKIYSADKAKIDSLYADLTKTPDDRFGVYRQADIPAHLHYTGNDRIGDLVVLSLKLFTLGVVDPKRPARANGNKATHGFDVALVPEMKGIFYAAGPDIKAGLTVEEFENIHIYPLIAKILGLNLNGKIDGDLSVLAPILK